MVFSWVLIDPLSTWIAVDGRPCGLASFAGLAADRIVDEFYWRKTENGMQWCRTWQNRLDCLSPIDIRQDRVPIVSRCRNREGLSGSQFQEVLGHRRGYDSKLSLKALKSDSAGQHSIRINDRYRLSFIWESGEAYQVEITDYL